MKLWSRGLGQQELKMDFMRYTISKEGQEVVISGRITDPVNWDFWIRFDENDVPGLVRVATNRKVIGLVGRRWFKKLLPFRRRHAEAAAEEPAPPSSDSEGSTSEEE
jgi:hypothetical protein